MSNRRDHVPSLAIGPLDRIMIGDEEVKVVMNGDTGKVFERVNGIAAPIIRSNADIAAMIADGDLTVERNFYDVKRLARFEKNPYLRDMPEKKQDKIAFKLEWVSRVEAKREENGRISTDGIRGKICEEYKGDLIVARDNADFRKRKFTYEDDQFDLKVPAGRTIREWTKRYRDSDGDWRALVDNRGTGLRESRFSAEELNIQGHFVMRFLSMTQPSVSYLFRLMKAMERRINRNRVENHRPTIRLGSRSNFYNRIGDLPDFARCVGRDGDLKARQRYAIVVGREQGYPMDLVEADECRLDLVTMLQEAKVWEHLSAEEQAAYAEASQRFWCSAVVDRATMCFLSLRLHEQSPSLDTALACFELTTRDKTSIAKDAGCKGSWNQRGGLLQVRIDCAAWYTSPRFTATMTDAGTTKMHPPAKLSFLRGTIERAFGIIGGLTLQNFSGRTFSSIVKRGDNDPKKGASVDREMLQHVLVRAVVDIHHNVRNSGNLAGMSPNQAWLVLSKRKRPPAPPIGFLKRHIYGVNLKRVIRTEGIVIMGFKYQSDEIQAMRREDTGAEVDIRVDLQDMGEITVFHGSLTYRVQSSLGHLHGRSYWQLTALVQELRLIDNEYTDRTQRDVDEAMEFIDGIADIGRAMRDISAPVTTWEHIERVERRVRRPLMIVEDSDFIREVSAQDWSRTQFLDEAWGLSDEPEGDDLEVPKSLSKEAIEAKYGSGSSRRSSRVSIAHKPQPPRSLEKPASRGAAASAGSPDMPAPMASDAGSQANYYDEF